MSERYRNENPDDFGPSWLTATCQPPVSSASRTYAPTVKLLSPFRPVDPVEQVVWAHSGLIRFVLLVPVDRNHSVLPARLAVAGPGRLGHPLHLLRRVVPAGHLDVEDRLETAVAPPTAQYPGLSSGASPVASLSVVGLFTA